MDWNWLWQYPNEKADFHSGSLAVLLPPLGGHTELLGNCSGVSKLLVGPKVPLQAPTEGDKLVDLCLAGTVVSLGQTQPGAGGFPSTVHHTLLCQVHFSIFWTSPT